MNPNKRLTRHVNRLLIRSTNWIGDAVMTTPAVRAIRHNFPGAHISLLAKPWVAPVFDHSPHVDEIIGFEANGRHKGFYGTIRLARDLRTYRFDAAIFLQNATFWLNKPRKLTFVPLLIRFEFCIVEIHGKVENRPTLLLFEFDNRRVNCEVN